LHAPIYKSMRSVEWSQLEMGVCLWIEQDSPFGWNTAGSFLIVVVGTQQPTSLPTYSIFSFLTRSSLSSFLTRSYLSSFLDLLLYQYVTPHKLYLSRAGKNLPSIVREGGAYYAESRGLPLWTKSCNETLSRGLREGFLYK
jgi:hypothetical protein